MEQIIIAIGRQNGSGGRDIAQRIANELRLKFYDVRILKDIAMDLNEDLDPGELFKFDEAPRRFIATRHIGEHTNSIEEILALKQFDYLREKAASGESFVILGRCADYILRDEPGLIKIFITADMESRIERIAIRHNVDKEQAERIIKKADRGRKRYYERFAEGRKWGDPTWHDIIIKSNTLGIDETADVLVKYINEYRNMLYND